jgi:hypothetical protein
MEPSGQDNPMSLDMIEGVLEVEEEFRIKIPRSEMDLGDAACLFGKE